MDNDDLIYILNSLHRSHDQLETLLNSLSTLEDFKRLIENLSLNKKREICRCLKYIRFEAGQIVYNAGELSDRLYIIIRGNVRLFKDETSAEGLAEVLGPGKKFGEREILKEISRSKTAIASSDVECVYLVDRNYKRIFEIEPISYLKQKFKYMTEHFPFIKGYSYAQKERIAHIMQIEEYKKGSIILEKDSYHDCLYFISEGEIAISLAQVQRPRRNIVKLGVGNSFGEEGALFDRFTPYDIVVCSEFSSVYKLKRDDILQNIPEELLNKWKELYSLKEISRRDLKPIPSEFSNSTPLRASEYNQELYPSASIYARRRINEVITRNSYFIPRPRTRNLSQPQFTIGKIFLGTIKDHSQPRIVQKLVQKSQKSSRLQAQLFKNTNKMPSDLF